MEDWRRTGSKKAVLIDLEALVPEKHLLWKIKKAMDYEWPYESACGFIECSKEVTRVEPTDHDVREIKREDGVTIRLHFSSGGVTLQECMVRILEKHIEKSTKS